MGVQSVRFPKNKFSIEECKQWLKDHHFKHGKVDKHGNFYKFRQTDPSEFTNYVTKVLNNGIELIIGFKQGGDIDLHSLLPKIPLVPPGFNYLGPNNPLEKQVDMETGIPRKGHEPTNNLDKIALKHDLLYNKAEKEGKSKGDILKMKHAADKIFVEEAEAAPSNGWWEKAWNWISRNIIKGKLKLGLGISDYNVISNLKKFKTKEAMLDYINNSGHIVKA
jgi:hypothetical protein